MKAFLLAAGQGTRLKPLTNSVPKCLVPINGIPLLQYWLKLFELHHIDEILINIHHLNSQVEQFCASYIGPVKINLYYEKNLLGSLGTIIQNKEFIKEESRFLICYSDNITNINLTEIINAHSNNDFTMGLFKAHNPSECGIITMDDNNNIVSFIEKPKTLKSNLANAGLYVVSTNIIFELSSMKGGLLDIAQHLIPSLIGRYNIKGYIINDFLMDIGTLDNYYAANDILKSDSSLFKSM